MAYSAVQSDPLLSASTKNVYLNTLELLSDLLGFKLNSLSEFTTALSNAETVYERIKERWPTNSTRARVLTVILAAVRLTNAKLSAKDVTIYKHIHWVLSRNSSRKAGKMTARERAAWVSHEEALREVDRLGREAPGSPAHLLLAMYTLWPPNRGDYGAVRIYDREADVPRALRPWAQLKGPAHNGLTFAETQKSALFGGDAMAHVRVASRDTAMPRDNFLVLRPSTPGFWRGPGEPPQRYINFGKSPRLVLLSHKTAGSHGRLLRVMPPALARVVGESLDANPRDWLFVNATGQPFKDSHAFTVWAGRTLSRIFNGRHVGPNILRHSFISAVDFNESNAGQLARLARDMGHSQAMQRRYVLRAAAPRRSTDDQGIVMRSGAGRHR